MVPLRLDIFGDGLLQGRPAIRSRWLKACAVLAFLLLAKPSSGELLDRTVARLYDPEAPEGSRGLRFVHERELVLETWLLAYERNPGANPYPDERALRAAFERVTVDVLLSARPLTSLAERRLPAGMEKGRKALELVVGGAERLEQALSRACGTSPTAVAPCRDELEVLIRRRARAEAYLESAIAQPVEPTDDDLLAEHRRELERGTLLSFESQKTKYGLRARFRKLREIGQTYFQAIRSRLALELTPRG